MVFHRLLLAAVISVTWSCAEPGGDERERPAVAGEPDELAAAPRSPPLVSKAMTLSPHRALAARAQDHLLHYGAWDAAAIDIAQRHDVVVLDPSDGVTRGLVAAIQGGGDPSDPARRVIVLCYISIGEDIRTADRTDEQLATDPRFRGDGTGPRVDPRGPWADGEPLTGIDPRGLPSPGGTGYASWYLDDVSVRNDPAGVGDGRPDRNRNFGGAFVNAGDPAWFAALQDMQLDGADRIAGLRELLTTSYGRGLGCDGVFLDTIDTAAPNGWTDAASPNETKYEWTAPGFAAFLQRLRTAYPDVVILQNRGLFFFNPWNPQYQFIPRGLLDFVLFESYRLNSASAANPDPYFYPDNRFNFAPKLMAEANRADGFRVLSVGYAEGPADQMSQATLVGGSTLGTASLLEDIRVTERLAGFRHYLTDASLTVINRFVLDHADRSDLEPPVWTSTWNDHSNYPAAPTAATPRVGVQQIVAGPGALTVRWDVALDLNRVRYALYYRTTPLDFAADPTLASATRVVLTPQPTAAYSHAVGAEIYANEATITGLTPGQPYHLVIRAFDDAPTANEERNQVVGVATPTGAPPYLGRLRASNGATRLIYRFVHSEAWSWRRVYVDRDRMPGTGWAAYGIGADFLIEERRLYRYTGNGSSWSWTAVSPNPLTMTSGPVDGMAFVQWDLDQAAIGAGAAGTALVFQVQRSGAVVSSPIYPHVYTTRDPASPMLGYFVENDAARIYLHAEIGASFTYRHVFLDDDANPATGYGFAGIGAGYLIENGSLYRHIGPGWAWTRVGSSNQMIAGTSHDWSLARAEVGATAGAPRFDVVFQGNGGAPTFVAPVYVHPFSR